MSPHILICLAAVLFAGMVQVKASDNNDCHAQQSFAAIFGDESLLTSECREYLAGLDAAPAQSGGDGGAGLPDFSNLLSGLSFNKKK